MQPAPLFDDVADGPDGGVAHWLTTADGLRIRVGHWPLNNAQGTVLLFPGRTEFIEKYGRAAQVFRDAGLATLAIDWRGQGLADRMHADRGLGHVLAFTDYQHDVAAVMDHVRALGLPEPYYLLGHSMGGAIGLRALMEGLPVAAAMFSAPMWGIALTRLLRPYAWTVSTLGMLIGQADRVVPGRSTTNFTDPIPVELSELSHDADMLAYCDAQIAAHPELGIGGPSLRWINETLHETRHLSQQASPDTPALTFLGTLETIVDSQRIRDRMHKWPNGKLSVIKGGKHEMMIETPDIRDQVFANTIAFYKSHALAPVA